MIMSWVTFLEATEAAALKVFVGKALYPALELTRQSTHTEIVVCCYMFCVLSSSTYLTGVMGSISTVLQ